MWASPAPCAKISPVMPRYMTGSTEQKDHSGFVEQWVIGSDILVNYN